LSKGYLYKVRKRNIDLGNDAKDRILATFLDLNRIWFLTGEGSMLQSEDCKQTSDTQEDADYWRDRCMNAEREAERLRGIIEGLRMAMGINTAVQDSSSKVVG